jgi:membrane complex biogenesis BtpA family protein
VKLYPFAKKPLVGVIHLPALPGSPGWTRAGRPSLEATLAFARRQAEGFLEAGMDGLVVENYGDVPFFLEHVPAETISAVAIVTREVVALAGQKPVGVNVLRNDARAALGIAVTAGARFIRVNVHAGVAATDQGLVSGKSADTLRARDLLGASESVAIFADVHVKHARPLDSSDVRRAASDLAERALADAIVVSGPATGEGPDAEHVKRAREGCGHVPLLIGSGLTPESCRTLAPLVDGAIVASWALEQGKAGARVDPARARKLVEAFRASG